MKRTVWIIITVLAVTTALILLITVIVLSVLYAQKKCVGQICTSDDCLRSAAHFRLSMNLSVDPCEDFYDYACGGWPKEHSNLNIINEAAAHINTKLNVLINKFLISEIQDNEPIPVKHAKNFYKSCIDLETRNKLGLSVLDKALQEVDLPLVPSFFSKAVNEKDAFKFNWLKATAMIKKTINLEVFFGFSVNYNVYKIFENVMYFDLPSERAEPSLPTYEEPIDKNGIVKILKYIVKKEFSKQIEEDVFQEGATIIENMRISVLKIRTEASTNESDIKIHEKIKVIQQKFDRFLMKDINKTYPDMLKYYVGYLFEGTNITIDYNKDVLFISNVSLFYASKIISLNLATSDINLEIYVWFLTVVQIISSTSSEFIEFYLNQATAHEEICSSSEKCVELVSDFLDMAVTYGVADKKFSTTIKPKVEEMISGIQDSFVDYVNNQPWIDSITKEEILDKNREVVKFIGFPDWIFEKKTLERYYEGYVVNQDTFLQNMINMIKTKVKLEFSMLRSTNKRNRNYNPLIVNAYNDPNANTVAILMAILNFPLYNLGLEMLHYGALGSILGHELIHGYDNNGKHFDKFGNMAFGEMDWWSDKFLSKFKKKSQCFVEQYNNYTLYGLKKYMQGEKTLAENLADNGGIRHSYRAYQTYVKKHGPELSLAGFQNFTSNQLFFIAFPSLYCAEINNIDAFSGHIDEDKHSPDKIRVLSVLRNFPEFTEAFNCPVGSNMNPKRERCQLW